MRPDQQRWRQIEQIYHAALERPPSKRGAFVAAECKGDEELRREVESLLGRDAAPGEALIDRPAWEGAGDLLTTKTEIQLTPGTQLGPYRVEQLIGSGGMGRVYRARDMRLGRAVAIKVSAEEFTGRFEREARAIAALAHPHICTLFDVGPNYLVMELVEGESLADRLRKGPLRLEDAIRYGSEIADALAAAHARGVVHRDLKPGNVMITAGGAKVLDFGLAKIAGAGETLTRSNAIMGTPAYMAPEQREGRECDARTDLFALGLLLYEAATGKRLAPGQIPAHEGLPAQFLHVVERCLAEEPAERWQSASDVRRELLWAGESRTRVAETAVRKTTVGRRAWIAAALVALGIVLGFALGRPWGRAGNARAVHLSVTAPPGAELVQGSAISPDGDQIVFVARAGGTEKLWLRRLSSPTPRELPGTEGGALPFWSPDSGSVGFFADGKLKRIDVGSGVTSSICDVGKGRGGTWNADGTIVFNSVNDGPLLRVAASGGEPAAATTLDAARRENSHRWPYFLPGGRRFLYFVRSDDDAARGIYVGSLDDSREKTQLARSLGNGIYAPSTDGRGGYLLWVRDAILMAQPLDPQSARLHGQAVALAESVGIAEGYQYAEISASTDSGIVYRTATRQLFQMTWYSRQGQPSGALAEPDAYISLRISPEGSRILLRRRGARFQNSGYATMELSHGIVPVTVLSGEGMAWSPEGLRIAYTRSAPPNLYVRRLDGSTPEERLTHSTGTQVVTDWSADGRFLLYVEDPNDAGALTRSDIWAFSLQDRKPVPVTSTRSRELRARFSPNGKWIGYSSDEPGRAEIFIESFPPGAGSRQVTRNGGDHPRWSRDGRELFYLSPDGTLMSVKVEISGNVPVFGAPAPLFKIAIPVPLGTSDTPYDVAPDGRILALAHSGEPVVPSLTVVLGWEAQLRAGQQTKQSR